MQHQFSFYFMSEIARLVGFAHNPPRDEICPVVNAPLWILFCKIRNRPSEVTDTVWTEIDVVEWAKQKTSIN